jgi:hypothetical protein
MGGYVLGERLEDLGGQNCRWLFYAIIIADRVESLVPALCSHNPHWTKLCFAWQSLQHITASVVIPPTRHGHQQSNDACIFGKTKTESLPIKCHQPRTTVIQNWYQV